jgi:hypothetical protein
LDDRLDAKMDTTFEIILPAETLDPPLTTAEQLIRGALLLGFLAVMGTEAWLLWQVWRLIG